MCKTACRAIIELKLERHHFRPVFLVAKLYLNERSCLIAGSYLVASF